MNKKWRLVIFHPSQVWIYVFLTFVACNIRQSDELFIRLESSDTGIYFSNTLSYTDSLSVLEFEYMYNGAGVGVIDVDNDGLPDLYFTGNMVSGKLYLNKGDFLFEDITTSSNTITTGWANGVSVIDINQDGLQDFYVSRGGPRGIPPEMRSNFLFINQGDNTFLESAEKYGLADTDYTVQATFLDFDKDGDLDLYLLSNALVDYNRNVSRPKKIDGKAPSVDKFYINNGDGTFTDKSAETGILIEGFGLGVQVCDLNEDSWPDIYVSNDFLTDDLIYINQQNGTFKNESKNYLKHLTYNGMGNDLADFNNDGLTDIVVLDMLPSSNRRRKLTMMGNNFDEFETGLSFGYQPQYIRNTLQLNNGNGSFSEIGQLAGIDATDWSWSALFADYDNDGKKDLFITNGYRQDITNLDFMVYGQQVLQMGDPAANRKQRIEALNELPGIKLPNYVFRNEGGMNFENRTGDWGLDEASYSNGSVYVDLNNDGHLDLVVNNIDQEAFVYKNTNGEKVETPSNFLRIKLKGPSGNRQGIGTKVLIETKEGQQYQYFTPVRGYLSSVEPVVHFGLGANEKVDGVTITWPDGNQENISDVDANQEIEMDYSSASPIARNSELVYEPLMKEVSGSRGITFLHKENNFVDFKRQPLVPHMHSRNGPGIAVKDIDNNGLDDFYVGSGTGYAGAVYLQQPGGQFVETPFSQDSSFEDMGVLFFDANGDIYPDLYIASGGSSNIKKSSLFQDRLFLNDGKGKFLEALEALPDTRSSGSVVTANDFDKDGDLDLFVGGRVVPGEYPLSPQSRILVNQSNASNVVFKDATDVLNPEIGKIGMVTSALWTDFDSDGWTDLMVTGEFMAIRFFKNIEGKSLVDITDKSNLENETGWWNSLVGGDFDNDGDIDYLAGNLGLNTRFKVSEAEPLCIYASDYDKNGRLDPVMCYYVEGENYVAHSRNDIIEQINAMRGRFRTYKDYAESTFERSFLDTELDDAFVVKATNFKSSYIENLGEGQFKMNPLPQDVQLSPIFGMDVIDLNSDGNLDVVMAGNFYPNEVAAGRYDASIGTVLIGDGGGGFKSLKVGESGFFADKDVRGITRLSSNEEDLFLVSNNSDVLQAFQLKASGGELYQTTETEEYALISYKDGRSKRVEFYHGSGYLSSASRSLRISDEMESIVIYDSEGQKKTLK